MNKDIMTLATVVPDKPPKDGLDWNHQFTVAIVMVLVVVTVSVLSERMMGTKNRVTHSMQHADPGTFPDLGWRLAKLFVTPRSRISLIVGYIGPIVSIITVFIALLVVQHSWVMTSLLNAYSILMAIRVISMLSTYLPAVWSREDYVRSTGGVTKDDDRFEIVPSGHAIGILLPLVFLALLVTDEQSKDRAFALIAVFFVSFIPLFLIFATRIHHTMSVVVAVALVVLMANVATEGAIGWPVTVAVVVCMLMVFGWNLMSFGWPRRTSLKMK